MSESVVPVSAILACIDAPDPDNLVQIVALKRLFPKTKIYVLLTGRPVHPLASIHCTTPTWEYDLEASRMAQKLSAARIMRFLGYFQINDVEVYDGGIAPRTLVPHHLHFKDYTGFLDVDPITGLLSDALGGQEKLIKLLLEEHSVAVVVGGPMTGLAQILTRMPRLTLCVSEIHAMFATWGEVTLMNLGDSVPRGAVQFNVACDPVAAYQVLMGVDCPIYLLPSEVTRVSDLGFQDGQALEDALPKNPGTEELVRLYRIWYEAAVKPRKEMIYIHDLVAAISLDPQLRDDIYEVVPIEIDRVPHLAREVNEWGKVLMRQVPASNTRFAARTVRQGGPARYREVLQQIFAPRPLFVTSTTP